MTNLLTFQKNKRALVVLIVFFPLFAFAGHGETDDHDAHKVDPTFKGWISGLKKEALVKGISQKTIDEALSEPKLIKRVIELDRSQPEFKLTFEQYFKKVVDKRRVDRGRKMLVKNRELLAQIEKKFGVQPRFVVALWGMETDYGRITGGFSVIDALVTLAYDGRRSAYFRKELINALMIIDQGHISAKKMIGSWAGAMGQTQFMPSTFLSYAVDFTGDGKKNVWKNRQDALASGANYLSKSGWKGTQTWGREVKLTKPVKQTSFGLEMSKPISEWSALGVVGSDGKPLADSELDASLINLDGEKGRFFLIYNNYRVIMEWNKSTSFATSVGLLADAIGN